MISKMNAKYSEGSDARNPNGKRARRDGSGALARRRAGGLMALALVGGAAGGLLLKRQQDAQARPARVYTSEGLGGWVTLPPGSRGDKAGRQAASDPLQGLRADYRAGRWMDVEAKAALTQTGRFSGDNAERRQAAEAQLLAGYAAAWRKEYGLAGERFRDAQTLAGELQDGGAPTPTLGELKPTLEQEAGFQHAVCRGAAGDRQAAEAEYDEFMRRYPRSVLIHAAIKRIARLHGGDIPKDAEALWTDAMREQKRAADAKRREESLCGPACLAELLRTRGKAADVHALADEMKTGADGTTLENLANAAKKHGFAGRGLMLTPKGLAKQSLPLIALLQPGHYVLVRAVANETVTAWDPNGADGGAGANRTYTAGEWRQAWTGMALAGK